MHSRPCLRHERLCLALVSKLKKQFFNKKFVLTQPLENLIKRVWGELLYFFAQKYQFYPIFTSKTINRKKNYKNLLQNFFFSKIHRTFAI